MRKGGSSREWRELRAAILQRDNYLCQIKLEGTWVVRGGHIRRCLVTADCVHHTRGISVTGDDPRYLQAACSPCNLKVGKPKAKSPDPTAMTQWW